MQINLFQICDFFQWSDGMSKVKLNKAKPRVYLCNMVCMQFRSGEKPSTTRPSLAATLSQLVHTKKAKQTS